jgi:hypothetical protein
MLSEADMGVTQMAMNAGNRSARVGDENLLVRFYTKAKRDGKASKEAGRAIFKDATYISIMTPGNKDSIIDRPASSMDIDRFPDHYRRWQTRNEEKEAVEGTPLDYWPGLSRSQVEELNYLKIYTVEQLASLSDAHGQQIMGFNLLKRKANAYLEAAETEKAAEEMRSLHETVAEQSKQIAKLSAALEVQQESKREQPKPRGRPRKADPESTEEEGEGV